MSNIIKYGAPVLAVVIGVWIATSFDNPVANLLKKA